MEMDKNKFLKFMVDEIERNQKEVYKNDGEGKKVVTVLIQIYTLVSDGKFDTRNNIDRISQEIKFVHNGGHHV